MRTRKDELRPLYDNIKQWIDLSDGFNSLNIYHQKALEIITELEQSRSTAWKVSNSLRTIIAEAQNEAKELRAKLESKSKALGLVVQALAETIGEQER